MDNLFKNTLKAFDLFKNKQKIQGSNVLISKSIYMFWKFIQCTTHWGRTQMLKKIAADIRNVDSSIG